MFAGGAYGIWRMEILFRGWQAADARPATEGLHGNTTS